MEHIRIGAAINKYKAVLLECNQLAKDLTGDKWTLGELKGISTDDFWNWTKKNGLAYDRYTYLRLKKYVNSEKEIWFDFGKAMWRKHRRVFQEHLNYIQNYTVKPFCAGIIRYAKRVKDMHDLAKHSTPSFDEGRWLRSS